MQPHSCWVHHRLADTATKGKGSSRWGWREGDKGVKEGRNKSAKGMIFKKG